MSKKNYKKSLLLQSVKELFMKFIIKVVSLLSQPKYKKLSNKQKKELKKQYEDEYTIDLQSDLTSNV